MPNVRYAKDQPPTNARHVPRISSYLELNVLKTVLRRHLVQILVFAMTVIKHVLAALDRVFPNVRHVSEGIT